MTDVTGRSFLSYRHSRKEEARLLIQAQHEHGIPTWRDVRDLRPGPIDESLSGQLTDARTANALVWLTPDVMHSPTIQKTELPAILERERRGDGFFVIPVCAGGLPLEDMDKVAGDYLGANRLGRSLAQKVDANPIGENDAAEIAKLILKERICAIHAALPAGEPLRLSLYTRESPPDSSGMALSIDWSHRFHASMGTGPAIPQSEWDSRLLPALRSAIGRCRASASNRTIIAEGNGELGVTVALGVICSAARDLRLAWRQKMRRDGSSQDWSITALPEPSGFDFDIKSDDVSADDIAVLISVTRDVEPGFGASRNHLPRFRGQLHITRPDRSYDDLDTPRQARDVVEVFLRGLKEIQRKQGARGTVHLFMAVPAGVAMMIGQKLNTIGPVQTYRYESPFYRKEVLLHPP